MPDATMAKAMQQPSKMLERQRNVLALLVACDMLIPHVVGQSRASVSALARLAILWHHKIMKSTIYSAKKSKRGRPPVDSEAVNVRVTVEALRELDDWRRQQDDLPGRPEAIRRLVEIAIKAGNR
jgi:hypothetical protein